MNARIVMAAMLPLMLAAATADAEQQADPSLQARNPRLEVTWLSPDVRLPPFDKVMLAPFELQFRPVAPMAGTANFPGTRTEFPVAAADQQQLADTFARIFREELAASTNFALVEAPGADVLLIRPALRDIVSRVPPQEPVGRSAVFVDTVGEATLVLEFVDAASGRTLATASDRRAAEPAGSLTGFGAVRANDVAAGQEVRRLARRWGMALRQRAEQLYFAAKPR
ncbi:MAG: hypothetical protein AMXMBFR8_13260 [Nevskiales bacterium]